MENMATSEEEAARIRVLVEEYVFLVDLMRAGQYADAAEWQALSSQRTGTHDELISRTGITERTLMYGYCRDLLAGRQTAR